MTYQERPSWDEYFMKLAEEVQTRTTCLRRPVGALIVKDKRILATGYNGVPTGLRHCNITGCLRQELGVPSGAATKTIATMSFTPRSRKFAIAALSEPPVASIGSIMIT